MRSFSLAENLIPEVLRLFKVEDAEVLLEKGVVLEVHEDVTRLRKRQKPILEMGKDKDHSLVESWPAIFEEKSEKLRNLL